MSGDAQDTGPGDGRRAHGERRRRKLLDAALEVIARDGAGQVTHRSVAMAAGVPPSSIAYYFRDVDDILVSALTRAAQHQLETIETALDAAGDGADVAETVAAAVAGWDAVPGNAPLTAEYELYLMAARRPELAPVALQWADRLAAVVAEHVPDPDRVQAVVSLAEGTMLQSLLGRTTSTAQLRASIERLLAD